MGEWKLTVAGPTDVRSWSFGRVREAADLYDPRIFGARHNYRCECGKYRGEDYPGIICDRCGVKIVADATLEHRSRMGHLKLPVWCRHPLAPESFIDESPICPLAYRVGPGWRANALGEKCERLVAVCNSIRSQLPPEGSAEHIEAALKYDRGELDGVIAQIIGVDEQAEPTADGDADALLPRLFHAILIFDPYVSQLARSCCMTLEIDATL